jgi:hypothetical protein
MQQPTQYCLPSHLRMRIAARAMCCERSVMRVLAGKATVHTFNRVVAAARSLRIPLGELPPPAVTYPRQRKAAA